MKEMCLHYLPRGRSLFKIATCLLKHKFKKNAFWLNLKHRNSFQVNYAFSLSPSET